MIGEYNATMADLKRKDFFKFDPDDDLNLVMDKDDEEVIYFDMRYLNVGRSLILKDKDSPVIIVSRKAIFKKAYRHD